MHRPHPSPELVIIASTPRAASSRRLCPQRALRMGRQRSSTDNHGSCPCPASCRVSPSGAVAECSQARGAELTTRSGTVRACAWRSKQSTRSPTSSSTSPDGSSPNSPGPQRRSTPTAWPGSSATRPSPLHRPQPRRHRRHADPGHLPPPLRTAGTNRGCGCRPGRSRSRRRHRPDHGRDRPGAAAGARSIDLTSRASRVAANRLYEQVGFQLRDSNVYRYQAQLPGP